MTEFELIKQCFSDWPITHPGVQQGIGDDCLIWRDPQPLVISTDTAVIGRHFPEHASPAQVAQRAFLPALSDLAAMAAKPAFFTLALSLPPALNNDWLIQFAKRLRELAEQYQLVLAGGDTTAAEQLTISIAVHGTCNKPLLRSAAQVGDDLWVSGWLGQAAAALPAVLANDERAVSENWLQAYWQPTPQLALAQQLAPMLNSCIDISDGLLGDAGHIAHASQVDFHIDTGRIPMDSQLVKLNNGLQLALSGGDDYQLCFSAAPAQRDNIRRLSAELGIKLSRIGHATAGNGINHWYDGDKSITLPWQSFSHFK